MPFQFWPYTNFQNLNLDWILKKVKNNETEVESLAETVGTFDGRLTTAETNASTAVTTANTARQVANTANNTADTALTVANNAIDLAQEALDTAEEIDAEGSTIVLVYLTNMNEAHLDPNNQLETITGQDLAETLAEMGSLSTGKALPAIFDGSTRYLYYNNSILGNFTFVGYDVDSNRLKIAVLPYDSTTVTFTYVSVGGTVLPSHTAADAGKALLVDYANNLVWNDAALLPMYDQNDIGKFLVINSSGDPGWEIAAFIKYVAQSLTDAQKAQARTNIGASAETIRETVSGATATLDAEVDTLYLCGTMTSLTIDTFPATGIFSVVFTSGSTATTLTVPNTLIMPDGFTVDTNKRYEINVMDGYAVVAEWSVTP